MPMVAILLLLLFAGHGDCAEGDEFFEARIRPVLVERCYSCHSAEKKMAMGGLRLDTAESLRKGGDSGPAIVVGDPSRSLLMEAVRYTSLRLKMPPSGKLSEAQIGDFERWIAMGAPDPRTGPAGSVPAASAQQVDLAAARKFWSFQPAVRPAVPAVQMREWVRSPVDAFLLAKLEQKGLKPAPAASRRAWIRRVTFDLTGLPPTPAEIGTYLADTSAEADRRVVDRLLASPHYGERWARHWLDLMRFAETNGHEFDNEKLDAWRYRDYVIRAFNQDLPYNQLVREHLAGDLLPQPRLSLDGTHYESPLGTGAYWFGEVLNSATDSVKSRADMVDNQIDVLGKAFLGLTLACARCHDHKFDPIPTADYYALAGVMHSTYVREAVIDSPRRRAEIDAAQRRIGEINARIRALVADGDAAPPKPKPLALREGDVIYEDFNDGYKGWTVAGTAFGNNPTRVIAPNHPIANHAGESLASSFGTGSAKFVGSLTSGKFKMPKIWVHVRMAATKSNRALKETAKVRVTVVADDHKSEHFTTSGKPGLEWVTIRMTKEIGRTCYFEIVDRDTEGYVAVDTILLSDHPKPPPDASPDPPATAPATLEDRIPASRQAELAALRREREAVEATIPPSAFAMISMEENPHNVKLHIRGNHQNLGAEVPRAFLRVLSNGATAAPFRHGSGRLELAEAIASRNNPLTARVMVNRVWKHHFGQGLVRSTDNFGRMGELPSHPELLDWLAVYFIKNNWSVKELHRVLTLSSAYRMSAAASQQAMEADPRNTLLHHMPVRRLEAEAIRDTMLAVSGMLRPALYGPSIVPHISKYQDGRGKPKSGPLDSEGRRSIYIQVRRNFIPPMFLAFDYPLPVSSIGTRGVSTVPSQALLMLNNELVASVAAAWARRTIGNEADPQRRIESLYLQAFGRPPEDWEQRDLFAFAAAAKGQDEQRTWTDICHVLLNSAEFLYVQ